MKKLLSIAWKGFKVYTITNALTWAFIGTGKFLKESDEKYPEVEAKDIRNTFVEEAFTGWKSFLDLTVEVVKDRLGIS